MVTFNLRLKDEVNDKIVELAKKDNRSKNQEIEYILMKYIEEQEKKENEK